MSEIYDMTDVSGTPKSRIISLAANGGLPQTIIIEGGEASVREELSLAAAGALVCEAKSGEKPCGKCEGCLLFSAGRHPDVRIIENEPKKETIGIEPFREMKADAFLTPFRADNKVYIVKNAQRMTPQAQNAILKIIEEPPPQVYFMFVCPSAQMLLPTVRSRSTAIAVAKMTPSEVRDYLKSLYPKADGAFLARAALLYACCDGMKPEIVSEDEMRTAFSLCDEFYGSSKCELDYTLLNSLGKSKNTSEAFRLSFNALAIGARDILLYRSGASFRKSSFEGAILDESHLAIASSGLSSKRAMELYGIFSSAADRLNGYANTNAVLAFVTAQI